MSPQKKPDDNQHFKIGRNVLFNQESIALLEARLQQRFLDVSVSQNSLPQQSQPFNGASPRRSNRLKSTEKPSQHHSFALTLDINKAKRTPLPHVSITNQSDSPAKEMQKENVPVPTVEELKARKRLSQLAEADKALHSAISHINRRVMSPGAPPIPRMPSASTSTKLIDEFKRKLKTLKIDSTVKKKSATTELGLVENANRDFNIKREPTKWSPSSLSHIDYSKIPLTAGDTHEKSGLPYLHLKRNPYIKARPYYFKKKSTGSIKSLNKNDLNKTSIAKQNMPSSDVLSSSYARKRSLPINTKCVICELELDTSYNLDNNEKIIILKCSHFAHEQCLSIEVELNTSLEDDGNYVPEKLFPLCLVCTKPSIPNDDQELNLIMSNAIANKISTISRLTPSTPSFNYGESHFLNSFEAYKTTSSSIKQDAQSLNPEDEICMVSNRSPQRELVDTEKENDGWRNSESASKIRSNIGSINTEVKQNRASVISATPLVISSAPQYDLPNSLKNNCMWTSGYHKSDILKKFKSELLFMFQKEIVSFKHENILISLHVLIETFGELRLVDKMEVQTHYVNEIKVCFCYLFTNAILFLEKECMKLNFMKINYLTYCEMTESGALMIKPMKKEELSWTLNCKTEGLTKKWQIAITNSNFEFDNFFITNTIDENELKDSIRITANDNDLTNFDNYFINGGIKFLQTGVDTRFYETDMEDCEIIPKPATITIILNQFPYKTESTIHIKNIIKALHLIQIHINLILSSSKFLKEESYINDYIELKKNAKDLEVTNFLQAIDNFESNFYDENEQEDKKLMTLKMTVYELLKNKEDLLLENFPVILLSNSSLQNMGQLSLKRLLMIEVGLMTENKSYRDNVVDIADWSDVMEIICTYCDLDFEEEDLPRNKLKYYDSDILTSSHSLVCEKVDADNDLNFSNSIDTNNFTNCPSEIFIDSPVISFQLKLPRNEKINHKGKDDFLKYDKVQLQQEDHERIDKFKKSFAAENLNQIIEQLDKELLKFSNI